MTEEIKNQQNNVEQKRVGRPPKNRSIATPQPPAPPKDQVPPNVPKDFVTYINNERKSDKKIT